MSRAQSVEPSVATCFDHEVITPPNKLRRLVSTVPADEADDPVSRPNRRLRNYRASSPAGCRRKGERLDRARAELRAHGFNKATREALFHSAHDIKGEAATFGYAWVAAIADSLCQLIEHTPRYDTDFDDLGGAACRCGAGPCTRSARSDIATRADILSQPLREVTHECLAHDNRDRPDHLGGRLAPLIVPDEPISNRRNPRLLRRANLVDRRGQIAQSIESSSHQWSLR
jgi:chemotaxis protein histidine kinase CheA